MPPIVIRDMAIRTRQCLLGDVVKSEMRLHSFYIPDVQRVINRLRIAVTKLMQDIVQNQAKHLHPIKSRDFLILQHPALAYKFPLA